MDLENITLQDLVLEMKRMNDGIQSIHTTQVQLVSDNETVKGSLQALHSTLPDINEQLGKNTQHLGSLEREKRRKNLLIFNIDEERDEKISDIENKIAQLIVQKLMVSEFCLSQDVDYCRRLGKVPTSGKTRPIILALTTERKKWAILKNCNKLKGSNISIREDYPEEVRTKRKGLLEEMKKLKKEGKKVSLVYDKLYIREDTDTARGSNSQKRAPSQSPDIPNKMTRKGNAQFFNAADVLTQDIHSQGATFSQDSRRNTNLERTKSTDVTRSRSNSLSRLATASNGQPPISDYLQSNPLHSSQDEKNG